MLFRSITHKHSLHLGLIHAVCLTLKRQNSVQLFPDVLNDRPYTHTHTHTSVSDVTHVAQQVQARFNYPSLRHFSHRKTLSGYFMKNLKSVQQVSLIKDNLKRTYYVHFQSVDYVFRLY